MSVKRFFFILVFYFLKIRINNIIVFFSLLSLPSSLLESGFVFCWDLYIASPSFIDAWTKVSDFFLISSIFSPFKASFSDDELSSIVFFSSGVIFEPCSFKFLSVEWIKVSA